MLPQNIAGHIIQMKYAEKNHHQTAVRETVTHGREERINRQKWFHQLILLLRAGRRTSRRGCSALSSDVRGFVFWARFVRPSGPYRADFFCVMALKNLKKYLRIHFFPNFFVASSRHRNLTWFHSASLIRSISMSAEVGCASDEENSHVFFADCQSG